MRDERDGAQMSSCTARARSSATAMPPHTRVGPEPATVRAESDCWSDRSFPPAACRTSQVGGRKRRKSGGRTDAGTKLLRPTERTNATKTSYPGRHFHERSHPDPSPARARARNNCSICSTLEAGAGWNLEGGLEGEAEGGSASNAFRTFLSLTGTETNDGWRALAWFGAEGGSLSYL